MALKTIIKKRKDAKYYETVAATLGNFFFDNLLLLTILDKLLANDCSINFVGFM